MGPSRPPLSASFHNFWPGFDARESFFAKALAQTFDVAIVEAGRDLQISSVFGGRPLPAIAGTRPLRAWWTGEVRDPQGQIFDIHFGFRPATPLLGGRWYRYPLWITAIDWWDASSVDHVSRLLGPRRQARRSRFCNFIYTNDTSIRAEFFLRLNEARPVDSCGRVLNSSGIAAAGRAGKMAVLAESIFTIAFENQISPGYVTEKLVDPLLAGSIPIYWGATEAKSDFNPAAFIHAEDFAGMDDLVRHVLRLADSPDALGELATASPFRDDEIPYEHTPAFFVDRIGEALSGPPQPNPERHWKGSWALPERRPLKLLERRIRRLRDRFRRVRSER